MKLTLINYGFSVFWLALAIGVVAFPRKLESLAIMICKAAKFWTYLAIVLFIAVSVSTAYFTIAWVMESPKLSLISMGTQWAIVYGILRYLTWKIRKAESSWMVFEGNS